MILVGYDEVKTSRDVMEENQGLEERVEISMENELLEQQDSEGEKENKRVLTSHKVPCGPEDDPTTIDEALSRPDAEMWRQAANEELDSFNENEAWDLVDLPNNSLTVPCKWMFKKNIVQI
ncbi:hypothetical protein JTB14_031227 [Gonioctena quinquepunctata]|nr:hypothetical protein JTB14_031227 [Gonioctena quinquepunctata]